jgi:hypothetical protein
MKKIADNCQLTSMKLRARPMTDFPVQSLMRPEISLFEGAGNSLVRYCYCFGILHPLTAL